MAYYAKYEWMQQGYKVGIRVYLSALVLIGVQIHHQKGQFSSPSSCRNTT